MRSELLPNSNLSSLLGALSGPPASSLLAQFPAGLSQRPRNRSEWEQRFVHWQRPASETEEAKIGATSQRISRAIERSQDLRKLRWTIVKQGSYHNNTNVRLDSDIDLCVCLTDAFFVDGPVYDWPTMAELQHEPLPFTFAAFREHLAGCLREEFGADAVAVGKKAIHINKSYNERIQADVVPAFTFQHYGVRQNILRPRPSPHVGIALLTPDGTRITNFPQQHYLNGCAKTDRTGRRYKRIVRILKRLRNDIGDNPQTPQHMRDRAKGTASFLIECLVFNCPDQIFQHPAIYDDVVAVLRYLSNELHRPMTGTTLLTGPASMLWMEVNGIKSLFGPHQAWSSQVACEFVNCALGYMAA